MTAAEDVKPVENKAEEAAVVAQKEVEPAMVSEQKVESPEKKPIAAGDHADEKPVEGNADGRQSIDETKKLSAPSFKEESNFLSDLSETERNALNELKSMVEQAIHRNELIVEPLQEESEAPQEAKASEAEIVAIGEAEKREATPQEAKEGEVAPQEEKEGVATPREAKERDAASGEAKEGKAVADNEKKDENHNPQMVDEDICLWGVPLLPSKNLDTTNVVLLKFLRARDFKVNEALEMLKKTIRWRKNSQIDSLTEEELQSGLEGAAYMNGVDREGHPVCYNVYGVFEDKDLYQKVFGSEEKCEQFFKWRLQVMEKGIKQLDFKPGGISSILQIIDLKNAPGPSRKEMRNAISKAVNLLQDNYPEFVSRNIFINVPFWYYAFKLSPFLTQRTKSKLVFARPAKVTETLLRYIPAENIPIQYGGLKREKDEVFSVGEDVVSDIVIKAGSTENVEIRAPKVGDTIIWDITVLGWEVNYKEEFVPTDEGSYTIIIQKSKKISSQEEPVRNSFRVTEPGKVVLSIENNSYWKKRALYRSKVLIPSP
ncbi:patellin-4 [Nymphaea colorata]|nr:patellin-4 [Nymphaea colorata]